jgi:DNA-binding transcriptional LysR family regulator
VVKLQSFTRAASELGVTPSGVSRIISRLEDRLGVRLLNRTTRSISLTDDGAAYHERCARILSELEDANNALARSRSAPRGRLRVDTPVVLGEHVIGPALPEFLKQYPEVSVDLTLRDQIIDPTAEGVDVVLRLAELKDLDMMSKRLGTARRVIVAAPSYLAGRARPTELVHLHKHECIGYLSGGAATPWRLKGPDGEVSFVVSGRFNANSGAALRQAAVAGLGLAQVFEYHVRDELVRGALVPVLTEHEPEPRPISALFARDRHALPKVRVFLDFLAALFTPTPEAPRRGARGTGRQRR